MKLTYTKGEDGLMYPELGLTKTEGHIGKYGLMREKYLKEHDKSTYQILLMRDYEGHLIEVQKPAYEIFCEAQLNANALKLRCNRPERYGFSRVWEALTARRVSDKGAEHDKF